MLHSLHGIHFKHDNDCTCCSTWMVEYLFPDGQIHIQDTFIPCVGLYKDSACAIVTLKMDIA